MAVLFTIDRDCKEVSRRLLRLLNIDYPWLSDGFVQVNRFECPSNGWLERFVLLSPQELLNGKHDIAVTVAVLDFVPVKFNLVALHQRHLLQDKPYFYVQVAGETFNGCNIDKLKCPFVDFDEKVL